MLSGIVKLLRLASFVICLIVIASFVVFAANKTKTASNHQREQVTLEGGHSSGSSGAGATGSSKTPKSHENTVHKTLDEASAELTSPFDGIVSGFNSEWASRGVKLLLALLLYGFVLGFLTRVLRVRS